MRFKLHNNSYQYAYLTLALICVFWCISIFDIILSQTSGVIISNIGLSILYKCINDFWAGLIIGLLLFPFYLLLDVFFKSRALLVINILFVLIVIAQFSLVKYSLTTLVNLGSDILGYSLNDIYRTIMASESFSALYFLPFIVFPLLFFVSYSIIKKNVNGRMLIGVWVVFVLLLGSLKLIVSRVSEIEQQNKLAYLAEDIIKFQSEKNNLYGDNLFNREDFPLMKPFSDSHDVLAPFFNINEEKPNVVIVIVEGLGSEFIGDEAYSGFTPYLDSLISKSLYWKNFVSSAGRTFGVLPSLLASLPFGETGFLELSKTPSYVSLISVLKANGYTTSYYSGDQSSFDKKINFLEYNDIDDVIDENKYGSEYTKTEANSGGFSWGYPDAEIFKKTLSTLDNKKEPRLDIIMTLTNHEPFTFPEKEQYEAKVDSLLNSNQKFDISKEDILANKSIYASLNYTDNSIKDFMNAYAKRKEYNNTIFIITGDHRLIPIAQKDKLCRYHVPLYIFSPMLKKPETFKSVSSHWDITPSLLAFLMNNYKFNKLEEIAWMGEGLDTVRQFRNIHKIPLMRYKGSISDFMFKDYLYSDGELYKINENFGTYKVKEDELKEIMADSLLKFKRLNAYVTQRNKIYPDSLNIYIKPKVEFSETQQETINKLIEGLNFDQSFQIAREEAFKKDYKIARLLCDYILNELPNHSDARTLKGRTLAWEGDYINAETELLNVIKRSPYYYDSYLALLDLYWWSNQEEKSEQAFKKGLANGIQDPVLGFKMAKAYERMKKVVKANQIMDSIIKIYPDKKEYVTFKNTLN
ncbi:sulfatase-like hydrolase/transferase [Gaetbulibacter sp. M235]|uniref:sulfatase-like hydrolase/transferase n=1 Tax=Gaetbulibacter sp. M235 TaxID=3126510 RepID=UPI00374F3DA3